MKSTPWRPLSLIFQMTGLLLIVLGLALSAKFPGYEDFFYGCMFVGIGVFLIAFFLLRHDLQKPAEDEAGRTLIYEEQYRSRSYYQRLSIYEDVLFLRTLRWGTARNESIPYVEISHAERLERFFLLYVVITGETEGKTWTREFGTENADYILELLAERGVKIRAA